MPTMDIEVVDYGPHEIDEVICKEMIDYLGDVSNGFLMRDGGVDTVVFIFTKDKHLIQLSPDWRAVKEIQLVYSAIEGMYGDCLAFAMITEGYVVIREGGYVSDPEDDDIDLKEEGVPCLLVQLRARDGRFWIRQQTYHKDGDEIVLDKLAEGSLDDRESDLLGSILDPWRKSGPIA